MSMSSSNAAFSFELNPARSSRFNMAALPPRVPRLARLLALAIQLDRLVCDEEICDYAALARLGQVSRARMSQIMNLVHLAPDIQEEILFMLPSRSARDPITLADVQPLTRLASWRKQRQRWQQLQRKLLR
jgi:hypothetical protein